MAIKNFLDEKSGTQPFLWTPPLGKTLSVTAGEYSISPKGGDVYSLSVTFIQSFQP